MWRKSLLNLLNTIKKKVKFVVSFDCYLLVNFEKKSQNVHESTGKDPILSGLSPKMSRFVSEYLLDFNATRAAIRAGYSKKTAAAIGYENLRKPYIKAAINRSKKMLLENTKISTERILIELSVIAFSNICDYLTWGPRGIYVKDLKDIPSDKTSAIKNVSFIVCKCGKRVRLTLHNKIKALEILGKYLDLFQDHFTIKA